MEQLKTLAHPAARIFMGLLFLISGLGKIPNAEGFAQFMASGGIPAGLAWFVIAFEILAGLALIAGFQTRIAALLLAGFSLLSGLMYHFDLGDPNQITQLLKNIALTGGYLMFFVHGAGRLSVDRT